MKSRSTLIGLLIVLLVVLLGTVEMRRQEALAQLKELTVQLGGVDPEAQEEADRVVKLVRKLMVIDESIQPTVATIVDVEKLKAENQFYAQAENGDNLIITPTRAILYSVKKNIILDVVPVQVEQPATTGEDPKQ